MDTTSIRRAGALLELARAHLPIRVESEGEFDDWNVVGPAFIAIAAGLLEGIFQSPPPRQLIKAEVLFRSLTDYVITFAWLAAPESAEARRERLASFVGSELKWREAAENKITHRLAEHPSRRYTELMEQGKFPAGLLEEPMKARIREWQGEAGEKMPDVFTRAIEADDRWADELAAVAASPFAVMYALGFAHHSAITHASVTAVNKVVIGNPPDLLVGEPSGLGDSLGPYGNACSSFAIMLLIAASTLGWPDQASVLAAATTGIDTNPTGPTKSTSAG